MKKRNLCLAVAGASLLSAQSVSAGNFIEDVIWVPQIGLQWKSMEFKQELPFGDMGLIDEGELDADTPSIVVSFTGIYKKGYISLKYEDSLDDVSTDSDVPGTNAATKVERTDFSVTLGYNVWDRLNVFAGYLEGETLLTPEPSCPADFNGNPVLVAPDCGFAGDTSAPQRTLDGNFAQDNYINRLAGYPVPEYEQEYKEDGWFLGVSYGWRLADTGTLSVSLAYADLDATYKDNYLVGTALEAVYDYKGSADGFSFGVNWSQPLTKQFGYYLDLRTQQYEADLDDSGGVFSSVKNEENITAITAGIQVYL